VNEGGREGRAKTYLVEIHPFQALPQEIVALGEHRSELGLPMRDAFDAFDTEFAFVVEGVL
jgi:hypothetical protein